MCTVKLSPAARVASEQDSAWFGLEPVIEHVADPVGPESIDQVTPAPDPAGSGSVTDTPVAVPVPELLTTILNPIGSPAFTDAASAVFLMWIDAGWQVMLASEESAPSLVVDTLAVL